MNLNNSSNPREPSENSSDVQLKEIDLLKTEMKKKREPIQYIFDFVNNLQMTSSAFSSIIRARSSNEKLTRKVKLNSIVEEKSKLNVKTIITRSTRRTEAEKERWNLWF